MRSRVRLPPGPPITFFARARFISVVLAAAIVTTWPSHASSAPRARRSASARESRIAAGGASLYVREIGRGQPVIVLHGGPDFDSAYLLPDLDRLGDAFRLVYYDQRGRGKSAEGVGPADVTLASDIDDVDKVRQHFRLAAPILLGHSWGTVLALEYALRYPARVSRLILMNAAPVSPADLVAFRNAYAQKLGADLDRQREIVDSAAYQQADPETVAARYRLHFEHALTRREDYETLMARMRAAFISQGRTGILKARAAEDQLMRDTWDADGYDLIPKLRTLSMPALIISGEDDFIPRAVSTHIAAALPNARLVTIAGCGHFSYLECPGEVRRAIDDFFRRTPAAGRRD